MNILFLIFYNTKNKNKNNNNTFQNLIFPFFFVIFQPASGKAWIALKDSENNKLDAKPSFTHANLLLESPLRKDFIKKQQQVRKSAAAHKEGHLCPEIKSRYLTNEPRVNTKFFSLGLNVLTYHYMKKVSKHRKKKKEKTNLMENSIYSHLILLYSVGHTHRSFFRKFTFLPVT